MSRNLKLASILFVLVLWASMMISYPPLLVLGALPFILSNRIFLVPFMILLPVVEGGFILPFAVPTETFTLLFIAPLLAFDIFMSNQEKTVADANITRFYASYVFLVAFGAFIAISSARLEIRDSTILVNSAVIVGQLLFFFVLYMAFVQLGIPKIRQGLQVMEFISVPLFIGFFIYMNFRGIEYGFNEYLNFGFTSHGTFSASVVGLSSYLLYRFIPPGRSFAQRIWVIPPILMSIWIITKSDSRNGLLSLFIMFVLSIIVLRGSTVSARRGLILGFVSLGFLVFIAGTWNSPTFVQIRSQFSDANAIAEVSTGRTRLWSAGLQGFLERPLTGHGGDNQISRQYAERTVGINNVLHNTILEVAFQYGLVGLALYFFLQIRIVQAYFKVQTGINKRPMEDDGVFLLPFLTYFSLLFSALFVSWIWRSLVWYHVGLLFAILTLHKRSLKSAVTDAA